MDTEGPYLASPDSLYYYYDQERVLKSDSALKWTVKQLKPSELLDMDSVLEAFVPSHLNNMFFHVHVIPDYEAIPYKVSFDFNTTADDFDYQSKTGGVAVPNVREVAMLSSRFALMRDAIGTIEPGKSIIFISAGSWALHDLLRYCLLQTGPADVDAFTWSISIPGVTAAQLAAMRQNYEVKL